MHANPGDHIVLSPAGDAPARAGEVLEARGPGHTAPFVVLWDDGSQSLVYPGPGSVLRVTPVTTPHAARARRPAAPVPAAAPHRRVHDWTVRIHIYEADDDTDAHAVLVTEAPEHLRGYGHSTRGPDDPLVPEVGAEVAVARALRRLADELLGTAASDIEGLTGEHDVALRPR